MDVELGPEAESELAEATAWYGEHGWDLAERFVAEVRRVVALLVERPSMRAEIEPGIRRVLLHGFPYSLIYCLEPDCIFILAVTHHKRHPDSWRGRVRRVE
ncbi:type II toxin-antitoxin system RelE/ParE family toxin [Nannocystaceae bacterium ST9]